MARKIMVVLSALEVMMAVHAAEVTNVVQCLNVELSQSVLNGISSTDCSTPQTSCIGFIKGMITGDYQTYLLHFSDAIRMEECGTADLTALTLQASNAFRDFVHEMGYSNHVIRAYSESSTGMTWYVSVKLQSRKGSRVDISKMDIRMESIFGAWRITEWSVDE